MEQTITCINCPVGCRMTVTLENGAFVSVRGNTCKRGESYARQECVAPLRMVTAVVPVSGSAAPLSVKTRTPIPKEKIRACRHCPRCPSPRRCIWATWCCPMCAARGWTSSPPRPSRPIHEQGVNFVLFPLVEHREFCYNEASVP